ncbi:DUF3168 domain-containing protein [Achromobacter sp. AGC39]
MLEPMIVAALAPLVEGRVFPDTAAGDTPMPFMTYQQVGGRDVVFVDGETADKQGARVQINVWAKCRLNASGLIAAARAILCGAPTFARPEGGPVSLTDPITGFKGATQDFMIWHDTL